MHENLSLDQSAEELDNLELHARNIVRKRVEADPDRMVSISKDSAFSDNPMERENVEEMQRVDKVDGLCDIYREVLTSPSLSAVRIPVVEETAPKEESFDILVSTLKGEKGATNCVFSCQVHLSILLLTYFYCFR